MLLATIVAVAGCADATLDPTRAAIEPRHTQYDAAEYTLHDLGTFAGAPTVALAIDKHGAVFGRYGTGLSQRSFRWTEAGGYEDLGDIDGAAFQVLHVNDHGLMNGSVFTPSGQRAAAWIPGTGFLLLDPDFTGGTLGNNDRGVVAGTRNEPGGITRAFVWSENDGLSFVPISVEDASSVRSGAADVNNVGTVAGHVSFIRAGAGQTRAYAWDEATGTTLIPPLGPASLGVTHVSDEGLVLGASEMRRPVPGDIRRTPIASDPGTIPVHAWKWSAEGGLVDLGTLGGEHSVAWTADREGNVYGWASDPAGVQHAVKWPAGGGVIDLGGLGGNTLSGDVNKHGIVAGWSSGADGLAHPVVFTPQKK